jgi:hypothetical protein
LNHWRSASQRHQGDRAFEHVLRKLGDAVELRLGGRVEQIERGEHLKTIGFVLGQFEFRECRGQGHASA